jgi:predicted nucleic acid-binding protein
MSSIYIDTSFILSILFETEKSDLAEQVLEAHSNMHFVTSGIAINEALYVAT